MWVLEACLLVTAHAAIRLTSLLVGLAVVVDAEDRDSERENRVVATSALMGIALPLPKATYAGRNPVVSGGAACRIIRCRVTE
ncbi:MAG: hypothetical protein K0S37_1928 [Microbacterium sp.]|jgi:hypothetical protein|nr:hypothetical protein [Microbacterium sp.]